MDNGYVELPDRGLAIEPIVGWRSWRVENGVLRSYTGFTEWPGLEPLRATCESEAPSYYARAHESPSPDCPDPHGCGVYAWNSERMNYGRWHPYGTVAYGSVSLWGRVLVTPRGYRAEFAYPKELWVQGEETALALSDRYRVPVHLLETPQSSFYLGGKDFADAVRQFTIAMQNAGLQHLMLMAQSVESTEPRRNRAHGRPRGRTPRRR